MSLNSSDIKLVLKEFKPSLLFLVKFLLLYFILTFLYSLFLESYINRPDLMTSSVTRQSSEILDWFYEETKAIENTRTPTSTIWVNGTRTVRVFEGCNGLNMMIIFSAFVLSFPGNKKQLLWYFPSSLFAIHILNLARVSGLAVISINYPLTLYFFHKYLFTAIIFIGVFILWTVWITKLIKIKSDDSN